MSEQPGLPQHARAFDYYPPLKRVQEYVRAHLQEPVCLERAAEMAHLRPKYFSSYFRAKVGLSFTAWVAATRVEQATIMFREHDYPVTAVAHTVGFRSRRSFERWFRRFIGATPARFKRANRPQLRLPPSYL